MAECLAKIAERKPDTTALVDEHGQRTFDELNRRVNRAIHALRGAGLADGATIAIMCGNRNELFELNLAAMHASWLIVPVNWHWVADELAYVLDDAEADALVVEGRFAEVGVEAISRMGDRCGVRVIVDPHSTVDEQGASGGSGTAKSNEQGVPDGFVEYEALLDGGEESEPEGQGTGGPMFYTSGTTGFPKGVRGGLARLGEVPALWELVSASFIDMLGLPADGVTLLEGPAYHSAQWVFAVFPLIGGGSTVVMRHKFDPAETLELIDVHGVTNVHLVPTQFVRMLKLDEQRRAAFDGSSLVTVLHGAAPCPVEVKRSMLAWWGPVVAEYYGGTEAGFLTMITGTDWLERPGSIGREVAMSEVAVLGDDGTPAEIGAPGQIWFRSRVGADFEYHKAPDKTAAAHREGGWGTLGDIGYVDADGFLFLSDRKIDMIISGGVNIYPAEIEGVLVTHPAVADAAVFGIPDDEFGEQVKAAVELTEPLDDPAEGEAIEVLTASLLAHCRQHLAGYKVPKTFDIHESLPRQPTGKLLKRQLRDPYWEQSGRSI